MVSHRQLCEQKPTLTWICLDRENIFIFQIFLYFHMLSVCSASKSINLYWTQNNLTILHTHPSPFDFHNMNKISSLKIENAITIKFYNANILLKVMRTKSINVPWANINFFDWILYPIFPPGWGSRPGLAMFAHERPESSMKSKYLMDSDSP